jgi:hypothetical protein
MMPWKITNLPSILDAKFYCIYQKIPFKNTYLGLNLKNIGILS